ncbi:MAG: FkbM family methyltransferase [Syntrophobacteraceae bacterium]|jgi:FkbM family methyltransferase
MMETIRKAARSVLGWDSGLYRAGATSLDFLSTVWKDGIKSWRTLQQLKQGRQNDVSPIALQNLRYPILIRPGAADAVTIINNVIREEYGHFALRKEPEWMIDAGAYIGDTTAYFLSRFPKLKVIALEPNPESYKMAKQNLAPYGDHAILLQKGLFSNEQTQCFSGAGVGASIATNGFEIDCTTISSLLEHYSIPRVDILKMDIEGAEEAIFLSNPEVWLSRTELLIIEIHSRQIQSLVSRVLNEHGFSMKQYRSIWYCQRSDK